MKVETVLFHGLLFWRGIIPDMQSLNSELPLFVPLCYHTYSEYSDTTQFNTD